MTNTVLQLDNVEFRRNRRVIITDVNLTINAGERWVLFGPNGIGKSTAVGMLATRTFPSDGRVFILGHQLGKYDVFKLRTRIGLASADLGRQFPEFEDPLDAVVTGLSAVTGRWRDTYTQEEYARARQLLRDFRVSYLEGKEMWRLSEGERTRVLIARALMGDPELLIMDEPTTGLDLGGREQVMRTLSRIGEENSERAVVLSPIAWRRFRPVSTTSPLWDASRFPLRTPPKRAWIQWVIPVLAPSSTPVRWRMA